MWVCELVLVATAAFAKAPRFFIKAAPPLAHRLLSLFFAPSEHDLDDANSLRELLTKVGFWPILGNLAGIFNGVRRRRFFAIVRGKIEGAKGWGSLGWQASNSGFRSGV